LSSNEMKSELRMWSDGSATAGSTLTCSGGGGGAQRAARTVCGRQCVARCEGARGRKGAEAFFRLTCCVSSLCVAATCTTGMLPNTLKSVGRSYSTSCQGTPLQLRVSRRPFH
jgi:hypothetical protein